MKKNITIKLLAFTIIAASISSCGFFKRLASSDLETEEDFIIEEISKEVSKPEKKKTTQSQPKKNKMNLCNRYQVSKHQFR